MVPNGPIALAVGLLIIGIGWLDHLDLNQILDTFNIGRNDKLCRTCTFIFLSFVQMKCSGSHVHFWQNYTSYDWGSSE